jgi:hypothetical protein
MRGLRCAHFFLITAFKFLTRYELHVNIFIEDKFATHAQLV